MKNTKVMFLLFLLVNNLYGQDISSVYPKDNYTTDKNGIEFSWNTVNNADYYHFQLSYFSDFSDLIIDSTGINVNVVNFVLPVHSYYWRVRYSKTSEFSDWTSSSQFTILSINTLGNLAQHYKSDTNMVLNDNQVSVWHDVSGNGKTAQQSVAASQPLLIDSVLNNYPAVRFDGVNDTLLINSGDSLGTAFIVTNWLGANTFPSYNGLFNAMTSTIIFDGKQGTSNLLLDYSPYFGNNIFINNIPSTDFSPMDRYKIISGVKSNPQFINDFIIGNDRDFTGRCWNGDIMEIILFKNSLDNLDRTLIHEYLRQKYAPLVNLGYDIDIPYGFADTSLTNANHEYYVSYAWNTGETTPEIAVSEEGYYNVTVTDIFGFTSEDEIYIDYPGISLKDTTICMGDSIQLYTGLGSYYSFLWSDGTTDSCIYVSEPGQFCVTVTDSLGFPRMFDTATISIDSFPQLDVLPTSMAACDGEYISLDTIPQNSAFNWSTGSTDSTCMVTILGNYFVEITSERGCVLNDTTFVNITGSAPTVNFTFDTVCYGLETSFTDLSEPAADIVSWEWDFGNGEQSTVQHPQHTYASQDTFLVSLTAHTLNCSNTAYYNVFVKSLPHADFNLLYTDSLTCVNTALSIENNSYATSGILNYLWEFDDTTYITDEVPEHVFTETGEHSVTLYVQQSNTCMDSLSKTVYTLNNATLPAAFDLVSPAEHFTTTHPSVDFAWNSADNALFYELNVADLEDTISIETESMFSEMNLSGDGAYTWWVTAYNLCHDTIRSDQRHIKVIAPDSLDAVAWYMADSANTVSGFIHTLPDLTGNGYDASQSTESFRPEFADFTLNGHSSMHFNRDFLFVPSFDLSNTAGVSFLGVMGALTHSNGMRFYEHSSGGVFDNYGRGISCLDYNGKLYAVHTDGAPPRSEKIIAYPPNDTLFISSAIHDKSLSSNETSIFVNASDAGAEITHNDNMSGNFTNENFYIGGDFSGYTSSLLRGYLAEMIIIPTAINDSNRNLIEQYLRHKYAPPVNLGYDIRVPYGFCDTTITTADKDWFTDYLWSTGSTDSVITVSESGEYSVTVTDIFGFTSEDDIRVVYPEVYQLDAVSEICYGDTLTWEVNLPESDYDFAWYNSPSTGNSATYWENTQAAVEITDSLGCTYHSDTISVEVDMYEFTAGFGSQDTALCIGNRLTFLHGADEAVSWLWPDGSTDDEFLIDTAGTYHATVTNNLGCVAVDTVDVSILGTVPEPDFGITGHCAGSNISLSDSSISADGTIILREWIYNDTVFDTGEQASISFASAGNYDITLQIYTDVGCHNTLTQTVEVHPLPVPEFAPLTACEGNALFFNNLSTIESDTIAFTRWQFFDGDEYHTSGAEGATHTYDSDGIYTVTMEAVSNWDCADQITYEVEIKPSPEADFAHSAACTGEPVFFSSQSSSNEPWNPVTGLSWNFGDGSFSTSNSPEHAYDSAGSYDMELVAIALNGCTDTMPYTMNVHHSPEAIATNLNACAATPFMLTDSSVAGGDSIILWSWQVDTLELSGQQPEIVMQDTGTYPLQLRVATEYGCIDEKDTLLYVWENPAADFSMPNAWGEVPLTMALENTSEGATAYYWDFGDSTDSQAENPQHTWQNSGRYDVQLVAVSDKGCSDTTVKDLRVIVPLVDVGVINVRTNMDGSYLWVEADIINAGTMPVEKLGLQLRTSDGYLFREYLDHKFEAGAVETYTFNTQPFIANGSMPEFVCVYLYPGTEDDVLANNEYCAINKPVFTVYSLYPNPVSGSLYITLFMPEEGDIQTEVFDATGRLVLDKTITVISGYRILTLDCTEYSSGRYTLRIQHAGAEEIRSFLVE